MSAIDIIEQLERQGVELWVDDEGLHYDGDISVITSFVVDDRIVYP